MGFAGGVNVVDKSLSKCSIGSGVTGKSVVVNFYLPPNATTVLTLVCNAIKLCVIIGIYQFCTSTHRLILLPFGRICQSNGCILQIKENIAVVLAMFS